MLNVAWQLFAGLVVLVVLAVVAWDVFPKGWRARRARVLATVGVAIGGFCAIQQAEHGGWWVTGGVCATAAIVTLARRVDRPATHSPR
jgi:hypothetical protein